MPVYYVGKGSQFGVFDKLFDGTDREIYDATIENLDNYSLMELTHVRRTQGFKGDQVLTDIDVEHFEKDWLGKWWPYKHVELVLKAGIKKAIQTALPENNQKDELLPIEALWVCATEDVFQVYVNEGPHQITMIVYTPPPGNYYARAGVLHERISVVKVRDDFDGLLHGSELTRLNQQDEWPVLIVRDLQYETQPGAPLPPGQISES
jgi:hypothetical protein